MSDLQLGLSSSQVPAKLRQFGPNMLTEAPPVSPFRIFLHQFSSPLIYVLLVAAGTTFLLKEFLDGFIILGSILINTLLGYYQEYKAQQSLDHLRAMVKPQALAWRDGKPALINAQELVPDDVVVINPEYSIPADALLLEADQLSVNEALLTGESTPLSKTVGQPVFMGTVVVGGHGLATITATGMKTKMGEIGALVTNLAEEQTPLQRKIARLAQVLLTIVVVLVGVIFVIGLARGYELTELFITSIALAVAAIPEGLAITITVILAIGMNRILKQKALVRRLLAAETLGATTIICTDKTGTLTRGQLTVTRGRFRSRFQVMKAGLLLSRRTDPLEISFHEWAEKQRGYTHLTEQLTRFTLLERIPFNAERKYTAALHAQPNGKQYLSMMGAPEVVLEHCALSETQKDRRQSVINQYAQQGYRILGFASAETTSQTKITKANRNNLLWGGLLIYADPLRPHLASTIQKCNEAGIRVVMITGDYPATATAIASEVGILPKPFAPSQIMTGDQLAELDQPALLERIPFVQVYARISPVQKLSIVQALKQKGEIVAMTGDGVNDAPALKQADIGIVVQEASDVSKQTADLVLLNSNFRTIVKAIREGRVIFSNIQKVLVYLLSDSLSELVIITAALALQLPLPLTAAHILWINLIEDVLPSLALAFEPGERNIMKRPPRGHNEPILNGSLQTLIALITFAGSAIITIMYLYWSTQYADLTYIRTLTFAALAINSLFYVFACRSLTEPLWKRPIHKNLYVVFSVGVGLVLLLAALYVPFLQQILQTVPLPIEAWYPLVGIGLGSIVIIEIGKWLLRGSYLSSASTKYT